MKDSTQRPTENDQIEAVEKVEKNVTHNTLSKKREEEGAVKLMIIRIGIKVEEEDLTKWAKQCLAN